MEASTGTPLPGVGALCRIRVSDGPHHRGVLTVERVRCGEVILYVSGQVADQPDRYSIQVGRDEHLRGPAELPPEENVADFGWRFLNHACEPNAVLRGRALVALADLPEGTEVTFDYTTTEWDMAHPFTCDCGAPTCLGMVRGYRYLDAERRVRILPWTAEHLRVRG